MAELLTPETDRIIATLLEIASARNKTPSQVAISWLLSRPEVTTVVIGADTPAQVEENIGSLGWELAAEDKVELDEVSAWAVNAAPR